MMRGFEVVVRPAVFPDIRPAPAQPVLPADDPAQGFATIHGNGAKKVSVSHSESSNASTSSHTETQRRVDEARIYQKQDDGSINKKNFVDVEALNKVWMKGVPSFRVATPEVAKNEVAGFDVGGFVEKGIYYYTRIKGKDNIEIRKTDIIKSGGRG